MRQRVLDISRWDDDIDLAAWKSKYDLWAVIIKVGGNEKNLGRYKDPLFEENYRKAINAGLHVGFYYYTVTTDVVEAQADANHMLSIVNGKAHDMPWYMDVEDPAQFKLSARSLTDVIKAFCNTLISKGVYAGLYTGGSAWLNNMYADELRAYANWIAWWKADWPTEAGDIGLWQQGTMNYDTGQVYYDDVDGCPDLDWCCVDYPQRILTGWTKDQDVVDNQNGSSEPIPYTNGRASDVISAAYGELGYQAADDPKPGSKYGRWMAELLDEDWLAGPSTEVWWCCMFVSWCLDQGGVKMDGFPSANTDAALENGANKYIVDIETVRYGDIVIFNWDWDDTTDHIGFATGEFDGVGFPTIEGNVRNAVKEVFRQLGNVAFVLRPPYAANGVVDGNKPSVSTDPKNNRDGGVLDVDGIGGWNTIVDLQHVLGTAEDGWISGQNSRDKDYHWGMANVSYEGTGSQVVMALQRKFGITVDGWWGPQTSIALQTWLVTQGYDIEVDGYFGRESVRALQKSLNDSKWK